MMPGSCAIRWSGTVASGAIATSVSGSVSAHTCHANGTRPRRSSSKRDAQRPLVAVVISASAGHQLRHGDRP